MTNLHRLTLPCEVIRSGFELFLRKEHPDTIVLLKTSDSELVAFVVISAGFDRYRNVFATGGQLHGSYTRFWKASGLHGNQPPVSLTWMTPEEAKELWII